MTVELEIQDGAPNWWLSPNIWTVSANPAIPVQPIVGHPCIIKAKVRNNGSSPASNVKVRFYWANPGVGFDRNSANLVGSSNIFLSPGQIKAVTCTTPWVPIDVNHGHECLLVEIFHQDDPLPRTPDFNTPMDRHVAQRNLVVITVKLTASVDISITNRSRKEQAFRIYCKPGKLEELKQLENLFSPIKIPFQAKGTIEHAGFVVGHRPDQQAIMAAKPILENFPVKGNATTDLNFVGQLHGDAALIHILQEVDGKTIGGLSILILSEKLISHS